MRLQSKTKITVTNEIIIQINTKNIEKNVA